MLEHQETRLRESVSNQLDAHTLSTVWETDNIAEKQREAEAKHDVSKAGATVGGVSVSASGVAQNDPNRQTGSWNQTIGSGKEFVGGALGLEGMKQEGQKQ